METRKKIFLITILALGILIFILPLAFGNPFNQSFQRIGFINYNSNESSFSRKEISDSLDNDFSFKERPITVAIYPIDIQAIPLDAFAIGIQDIWSSWMMTSPSLVYINSKSHPIAEEITKPLASMRIFARSLNVDYLYSAKLNLVDGKLFITPILYDRADDLILKGKTVFLAEDNLYESILDSLFGLYNLTSSNLKTKNAITSIEPGDLVFERYNPSADSLILYFKMLQKIENAKSQSLSDWEDLAKREPFFWNPWSYYIKVRFAGKEESYDAKYFLENLGKKGSKQFHFQLANISSEYAEICLKKNNRYQVVGLLDLARSFYLSSAKTYTLEYANFLRISSLYSLIEKNPTAARLDLLNAQEIYTRLGQKNHPYYISNQFQLAQLYRENGQSALAIIELEDALNSSQISQNSEIQNSYFIYAQALYNLGTLNLELNRAKEAESRFLKLIGILQDNGQANSDLMLATRVNLGATYIKQRLWNQVILNGLKLDTDLKILGLDKSDYDSKNLYNLAMGYGIKQATETAKLYYDSYSKITPYSKIRPYSTIANLVNYSNLLNGSQEVLNLESLEPETFETKNTYSIPSQDILTEPELTLLRSFTGKYRIGGQTQEIRARTYSDRLEDHDIFLSMLLGKKQSTSPEMTQLKKLLKIQPKHRTGEDIVFIDIGPALGNLTQPAITSISLARLFPNMNMVLLELPEEVNFFFTKTEQTARDNLLAYDNIRIISGDGVTPLKNWFASPKGWVLENRSIPKITNKLIILRAANSIDIYEPFSKVYPFLESIVKDYSDETVILFFNRTILVKPKYLNRFMIVGSQSLRGFYHNSQSLDRQGDPPYWLSSTALGKGGF
ncbi:tetratricopeptide repeat protein [Leptospira sp. GIMC2001]|uniref:tetratricopeptide repeat protein n=1 Tax=Leptospira sp. GIMC2001 TaxID=1513297 RepID=UPI00234BACBC|nr:tetratricopeptide repeat protein [Leptospira sp. GIMC2001]WCL50487.1 tetratricopeptide repeat protein [Leptospira sp. GIMC2001]